MRNRGLPVLFFIAFFWVMCSDVCGQTAAATAMGVNSQLVPDPAVLDKEDQTLFNGRVWRNLYYKIKEDQFLYSKVYLPGSVSIGGENYGNVHLLYDIYTDEIITHIPNGTFLQLNKEMVDSFSLVFGNSRKYFKRIEIDTIKGFKGYLNVLYSGKSSLYVKYKKEIELMAVDRKYDEFYQTHKIFLVKDSVINIVNSRRDLLVLLGDQKPAVKSFIKKNRLFVTVKKPESLVPVIQFYESLH